MTKGICAVPSFYRHGGQRRQILCAYFALPSFVHHRFDSRSLRPTGKTGNEANATTDRETDKGLRWKRRTQRPIIHYDTFECGGYGPSSKRHMRRNPYDYLQWDFSRAKGSYYLMNSIRRRPPLECGSKTDLAEDLSDLRNPKESEV